MDRKSSSNKGGPIFNDKVKKVFSSFFFGFKVVGKWKLSIGL